MDWRILSALPGMEWPAIPSPGAAPTLALLYQFGRSQWWPPSRLREQQARQLGRLLEHAYAHVPYYRARWGAGFDAAAASREAAFAGLPLLSRRDAVDWYEALQSEALPPEHGKTAEARTSGSTGSPVCVRRTGLTQQFWNAVTLRDHVWHRRDLNGRLAAIRSGSQREDLQTWGLATDGVVATGGASLIGVGDDAGTLLDWLRQVKPAYIITYASLLAELARLATSRGERLPGLREVRSYGEALAPDVRELCAEAWGVPLVDVYSAIEVGYIALQCPLEPGHYHVQSESVLLEVLDEADKPCAPGEVGRVVVTDLHNFANPLIRYEIGDYAALGEACSCGRGLPVISRIAGRVRNMLVGADSRRYWPRFASSRFAEIARLRQHQLAQVGPDLLELRLVVDAPLDAAQEEQIRALVLQELPAGMTLRYRYFEAIPRGANGKFEDFVCELGAQAMSRDWRFESVLPGSDWPAIPAYAESATLALLLQLEASEWHEPARLEEAQMRQARALAQHAWRTVPYYRKAWAGCYDPSAPWSADTLRGLPVLTRRDLQARYGDLKSRAMPRSHGSVKEKRTSGSSGTPLRVLGTDVTGLMWGALTLRDHVWHQRELGRKLAVIRRGPALRTPSWGVATAGLIHTGECVMRDIDASADALLDWLAAEQPGYLLAYPSLVVELAKAALRRGIRLPSLLEVRTFGESLGPDTRALCHDAWGVPVTDTYSAEEVGYIALQCPRHEHYHVQAEHVVVEILDERGVHCAPGETGRVVITDLHNFALPLVRYDIGDYASLGAGCDCGRNLPVLRSIAGRVNGMLVTASGERFWPVFGMRPAQSFAAIRQHQFVQKRVDLVEALLVVDAPLSPETEERLRQHMERGLPAGIRVQIVYCDALPRTPGGKFHDFISEIRPA